MNLNIPEIRVSGGAQEHKQEITFFKQSKDCDCKV